VTYTEGIPPQNGRDQQETNQCLQELPRGRIVAECKTSKDRGDDRGTEEQHVIGKLPEEKDTDNYHHDDWPHEHRPKQPFLYARSSLVFDLSGRPLVHRFGSGSHRVFLIIHKSPSAYNIAKDQHYLHCVCVFVVHSILHLLPSYK